MYGSTHWKTDNRIAINMTAFADYATYYQIQISTGGPQRLRLKKYINIDNRLTTLKHRFLQAELIVQDYADQDTLRLHMEIRQ